MILDSCDENDRDDLVKMVFKILFMFDTKQTELPPLVAFIGGMVS